MKKILFIFAALNTAISSFAQSKAQTISQSGPGPELTIGVDGGMPLGNFGAGWYPGIGGTVKFADNINQTIAGTLETGFMTFSGKQEPPNDDRLYVDEKYAPVNFVPIKIGVRYSLKGGIYLEPQLGVTAVSESGASATGFTYAINVGYLTTHHHFDVSTRYEGISNEGSVSFIGLRLAYNFLLAKK